MARNPTSLCTYLFSHAPLRQRLADIRAQSALMEDIAKRLSPALREHCMGARRDGDSLVIFADSGVWATRLRYELPSILPEMPYRNFRVKVMPGEIPGVVAPATPRALPHSAALALRETAAVIQDDELSAVLRRLASHRTGADG